MEQLEGLLGRGNIDLMIQATYFIAAILFIFGLKRMSHPRTAREGIIWAGVGMVVATLVSFAWPGMHNYGLMTTAIFIGGVAAWWSGKRVAMTDMPQMIALYNGMGGGAAGAIAAVELLKLRGGEPGMLAAVGDALPGGSDQQILLTLAIAGAIIGTVSFSGSLIAFAKLQGIMRGVIRFPGLKIVNLLLLIGSVAVGGLLVTGELGGPMWLSAFFGMAFTLGIMMTVPIGGADMPVVISLYNALTGLAVAFEGFVLQNPAMIIAGTVVGSAGTLLTQLMAKAMNRSLANVLFSNFGEVAVAAEGPQGSMKAIESSDAAVMLAYAAKVVIIPGYGMAVAQAQHKVWELVQALEARGVRVSFAIHPVAGRMPGHMNVLLAEAGVPYDKIFDLDEINEEFANSDVAVVIGANDVVNPIARSDPSSPIYGMPILNADYSKNVIVVKRGQGKGFSGIENQLFFLDNTRMLYGDAQAVAGKLIASIKEA